MERRRGQLAAGSPLEADGERRTSRPDVAVTDELDLDLLKASQRHLLSERKTQLKLLAWAEATSIESGSDLQVQVLRLVGLGLL